MKVKPSVKEHNTPIVDIATCHFDDITCTCDVNGHIIVWSKNMKSAQKKITTESVVLSFHIALRNEIIVGSQLTA